MEFKNLDELYLRLIPCINAKLAEIKRKRLGKFNQKDIWNYLAESKWKQSINLFLYDMASDILYLDDNEIIAIK